MEVPEEPLLFLKPSTAVIGPGDPIQLLPISKRVDYEGELAVVIGRLARDVRAEDAYRYILGYTCANDVTLRDLQRMDDQWARAKGFDGSCPLGPWIETELDPNDIRVETRLNGEIRQAAQTSDMVFGVATLIEYITEFMTLLPGDVILTGTPEGVGPARGGRYGRGRGRGRRLALEPCGGLTMADVPSAAASRRRRPGRSTWGTRARRCSAGCSRAITAARSSCGWRTRTRAASAKRRINGVIESLRWLGSGLGRGPGRRRSARAVPAIAARRDLPTRTPSGCSPTVTRIAATARAEELEERREVGDRAWRSARIRRPLPHADRRGARRLRGARAGPSVVRFAMPDRDWVVDDLVKGEVHFPVGQLRDFVLVRSDGSPVFLLAVAVDDMLMGDHPRHPRGRPARERASQRRGDRGPRRDRPALRPPAAGPGDGRQASVQAPRLYVGRGLPRAGFRAGGADELPGAPRLVEGRVHDVPRHATS